MSWWKLLNRGQWTVFVAASLAWLFDTFDGQFFNLARDPALEQILGPTKAIEYGPYTTSVFLIGWAIGGLWLGSLGDRYGRARVLSLAVLLYSVFTGLSSLSTGFADFCVYRLLTGIGIGGVFGLAVALVADSVPTAARAPALGLLQSLSTLGNLAAGVIGMLVGALAARHALPFALKAWQVLFLIGALPAFLCVFIIRRLNEPEKWRVARAAGELNGVKFGSYARLLRHPKWAKHAWLALVLCSAGIVGLWGVGNFHPKIVGSIIEAHFAEAHLSPEQTASELAYWRALGLLLQNVGGFCGMLCLSKFAQVKGRKAALALSLVLSFGSTLVVFEGLRRVEQMYWMLPLMGFGQLSVLAAYAIYLPELFPTSLRSTGTSFSYNFGRLAAAAAPFTLGKLTKQLGGNLESFRTAGCWISLVLLLGLVVLPFLPETKGQPLPEEEI